ncbi:phosphatidylglycerophosphatase A [mine drainage metagenome]|uniref:Phosphatidylglycerophosphatase A n=1 Tax=mine drainage metagenome TaxID=410659 RepID=A0A1J5RII6_9ZZZZ
MIKRSVPPPWRFLFSHPAHFVACGLGSGLSPLASGTVGTLFAWIVYPLLRPHFGATGFAVFLILAFLVGVSACGKTGRDLGVADHGAMVWDEIVPFWLVLFLTPTSWAWQLAAFGLFRLFDIFKPPPARFIDRNVKNGFGVMADDVVAALYALLALALAKALLG